MLINLDDWDDAQQEIYWGILDGMPRDEREAYFIAQGLTADGLPMPIDLELAEATDLLNTIDGRASE